MLLCYKLRIYKQCLKKLIWWCLNNLAHSCSTCHACSLDDQLSAASTTIQHCSQTKRCLFAFKLCCEAYQRSTAPNLLLSLQTEISVCPFPTAHCQKQAQRWPKSLQKCWFVAAARQLRHRSLNYYKYTVHNETFYNYCYY